MLSFLVLTARCVLNDVRWMICAFQVNGKTLKFKRAVVATGGSAALPPIPGLKESPYLTNASVFNLTVLPRRMVSVVQALFQNELQCNDLRVFLMRWVTVLTILNRFIYSGTECNCLYLCLPCLRGVRCAQGVSSLCLNLVLSTRAPCMM